MSADTYFTLPISDTLLRTWTGGSEIYRTHHAFYLRDTSLKYEADPIATQVRQIARSRNLRIGLFYPVVGTAHPCVYLHHEELERARLNLEQRYPNAMLEKLPQGGWCLVFRSWDQIHQWLLDNS